MRTVFLAILFAVLVRPAHAQFIGSDPVVEPFCAVYKNPALKPAAELICEGRLLRTFAGFANEMIAFTKPLPMVAVECGQSSVFYDRSKRAIFVCYELAREVLDRIAREAIPVGNTRSQAAAGALYFAFAHELGHAAINLHSLPVRGREEEAADQIAALLLTQMAAKNQEGARYWTQGAHWYFINRPVVLAPGHSVGEQPPGPQRQFDVACWIYGSNPGRYASLAQYAKLPEDRARGCPEEFQQMANTARQILSSHLKE